MTTATYPESYCCDGTGWTGDPHEICAAHYEPVDPAWINPEAASALDQDWGDWFEETYDPDGPAWLD